MANQDYCSSNATENHIKNVYGKHSGRLYNALPEFAKEGFRFLLENPFVGVVGFGTIGALLQRLSLWLYQFLCQRTTITLEVSSGQETYKWLSNWLNAKDWGFCRHVNAITSEIRKDDDERFFFERRNRWGPEGAPGYRLVPNLESNGFIYLGRYIHVYKTLKEHKTDEKRRSYAREQKAQRKEVLILRVFWTRDNAIFNDIMEEARKCYIEKIRPGIPVFVGRSTYDVFWEQLEEVQIHKRPLESVVLDEGVMESITGDLELFINDSDWYAGIGVPYRRGYLLHGPPGSGKTSVICALAGHFDYGISIMSLSSKRMDDEALRYLVNTIPHRTILLMEDIDSAFQTRKPSDNKDKDTESSVTFSGLLNALDGVASAEARILFMTTNYVERLDPALIRPGRVDLKQKIDYASAFQIRRMFRRFFPNADSQLPDDFVQRTLDLADQRLPDLTPAQLQGFLLINRADPQLVFDKLPQFLEEARLENLSFTEKIHTTEKQEDESEVKEKD